MGKDKKKDKKKKKEKMKMKLDQELQELRELQNDSPFMQFIKRQQEEWLQQNGNLTSQEIVVQSNQEDESSIRNVYELVEVIDSNYAIVRKLDEEEWKDKRFTGNTESSHISETMNRVHMNELMLQTDFTESDAIHQTESEFYLNNYENQLSDVENENTENSIETEQSIEEVSDHSQMANNPQENVWVNVRPSWNTMR